MVSRIEFKSRVGADGVLNVKVPLGVAEADREVVVTVETAGMGSTFDATEWGRFIGETAGSVSDPTFERHDQGGYEDREPLA